MVAKYLHDFSHLNPALVVGQQAVSRMPEFAIPIARCVTMWPHIEHATSSIMASIVGPEVVTVMAMHIAVYNYAGKLKVLEAAVKSKVNDEDFHLFKAIMNLTGIAVKERHVFAHWTSAYSPHVPNVMFFVQIKDTADMSATILHNTYNRDEPQMPIATIDHKKVRAFSLQDAENAARSLEECHRFIDSFGWFYHLKRLSPESLKGMRPAPDLNQPRDWLLAQPQIQQQLKIIATKKS